MKEKFISRRKFLKQISIFFVLIISKPSYAFEFLSECNTDNFLSAFGTNIFSPIESAIAVGNEFISLYPNEADQIKLTKSIFNETFSTLQHENFNEVDKWVKVLNRSIRNDFHSENTILMNGWILSLTELRICALVALETKACVKITNS